MSSIAVAGIVFVCAFGGAIVGMLLHGVLPERHLSADSKDVVKLAMGVIATMAALVVGLLVASAKGAFDTQNTAVKQSAADILMLDRVLAQYGPETKAVRDQLRAMIALRLALTWPEDGAGAKLDVPQTTPGVEAIEKGIRQLSPGDESQRGLQSRALQLAGELQRTRWLLFAGAADGVPMPFLLVLIFWFTTLLAIFGLLAAPNATVGVVLFVAALSIACSIFLILEMSQPFEGLMKISSAPLRYTLAHLGQ
jgi:hypothetical protein